MKEMYYNNDTWTIGPWNIFASRAIETNANLAPAPPPPGIMNLLLGQ
jgi:hypothetical protein